MDLTAARGLFKILAKIRSNGVRDDEIGIKGVPFLDQNNKKTLGEQILGRLWGRHSHANSEHLKAAFMSLSIPLAPPSLESLVVLPSQAR